MVKMGPKTIGTPVRCPKCRHPNLAIDIWCERCGTPLDWKPTRVTRPVAAVAEPVTPVARAETPAAVPVIPPPPGVATAPAGVRRQYCWNCGAANGPGDYFCGSCGTELGSVASRSVESSERRRRRGSGFFLPLSLAAIKLPRLRLPRWQAPQWQGAALALSRVRAPTLPRTVVIAGLVLAVLLLVPLAYLLSGLGRPVAGRQVAVSHLPTTSGAAAKAASPQAIAIAAVEAKTGLKYSSSCSGSGPCLSISGQTIGQGAAAVVFSTARSGGRECVSYLVQKNGAWQPLGTVLCALPNQVSPLVGHDATVHVPGNCANVHAGPSLQGGVVTCLRDGTTVHVVGGPTYADGFVWWHTNKGWMAHDFLVAP